MVRHRAETVVSQRRKAGSEWVEMQEAPTRGATAKLRAENAALRAENERLTRERDEVAKNYINLLKSQHGEELESKVLSNQLQTAQAERDQLREQLATALKDRQHFLEQFNAVAGQLAETRTK